MQLPNAMHIGGIPWSSARCRDDNKICRDHRPEGVYVQVAARTVSALLNIKTAHNSFRSPKGICGAPDFKVNCCSMGRENNGSPPNGSFIVLYCRRMRDCCTAMTARRQLFSFPFVPVGFTSPYHIRSSLTVNIHNFAYSQPPWHLISLFRVQSHGAFPQTKPTPRA